jgi:hypothetical protein
MSVRSLPLRMASAMTGNWDPMDSEQKPAARAPVLVVQAAGNRTSSRS